VLHPCCIVPASFLHPCSTRAASLLHPCCIVPAPMLAYACIRLHRCLHMLASPCIDTYACLHSPASMLAYACIRLHRCLHMLAFACIEPNRPKAKRAGSFDSLVRESSRRARRVTACEERERGRTPVPPPSLLRSFPSLRRLPCRLPVPPSFFPVPSSPALSSARPSSVLLRSFVAFSSLLHSFSFFHRLPCRLPRPSPSFSSFPVPVSLSPWSGALLVS